MQIKHTALPIVELGLKRDVASDKLVFAQDVAVGLSRKPKALPSRYFYDSEGSRLFQQIMDLPEYYLTRCEYDVLSENRKAMAQRFSENGFFHLIDLGAGDALKTKILLHQLTAQHQDFEYVPVDISGNAMEQLTVKLQNELPELQLQTVIGEYFMALKWLHQHKQERKVVLFLGSNIGNFNLAESKDFLRSIRSYLRRGDKFLMGIDLRKDPDKLIPAYDDAAGVTSTFNLNLLHRINQELGGNFDLGAFRHYAMYEPQEGAMKSYLISEKQQQVYIKEIDLTFHFEAWEAIQTESSYKYSIQQVQELGRQCGFTLEHVFQDKNNYFADVLFNVD
ncbi:L-histidine N(alpha)-methyltransferase [Pontibacter sp. SGAir0037]|uniref:L-histidine N(alpha)-methyltransferase n=1 Tax=Pontibacter sp. SGAir0037 TaxID=2571030 RepID=UPI0010CCC301|nr:L-histidine N(alpha)-methyltransferase [Pontibacter sp. SGAir0037]QCR21745.1 L-histidine N(alpha)-methyltransferase [Pontibacter sp. SGAir0037]